MHQTCLILFPGKFDASSVNSLKITTKNGIHYLYIQINNSNKYCAISQIPEKIEKNWIKMYSYSEVKINIQRSSITMTTHT